MDKMDFLNYLKHEYQEYCVIPSIEYQKKREKREFINGLMKGSRFFGVSFDDLEEIVQSQSSLCFDSLEEMLEIPTYIRMR
ncbi:hypothetical protein C0W80_17320 [Photobacterium leiognathi subsp. mandapamensis]|uniref:hypothetical protein n=1 Tax=Photobacterium leiognathi TaxID=553611 RepID=UPI000D1585C6|nr:hypothetical protein [Photobacterium leiognathi]PSU96364.1 hypothetical protein C0W80_17320 [Photobacterium leiognathi subsp. mandapamensis]